MKNHHHTLQFWLRNSQLFRRATAIGLIVATLGGMSSCQIFRGGSSSDFAAKYSLKKRKSHISCLSERGGTAVIKPLPLKVSDRMFEGLFYSIDELLGTPYRGGGNAPGGFDCSGLVHYLYKQQFRMILPRTASELAVLGSVVPEKSLKRGDLIFFSIDGNRIDHVGIATGRNQFAHAATSGVRVDNLLDPYYKKRYAFSSRIITAD